MSIQSAYRGMPTFLAIPLAIVLAALGAAALAAVAVVTIDFALSRFGGPDGPGAGVQVILVAVNVAVTGFIAFVSAIVNLYRQTTWLTPTLAFAFCTLMLWVVEPFDLQFAP